MIVISLDVFRIMVFGCVDFILFLCLVSIFFWLRGVFWLVVLFVLLSFFFSFVIWSVSFFFVFVRLILWFSCLFSEWRWVISLFFVMDFFIEK